MQIDLEALLNAREQVKGLTAPNTGVTPEANHHALLARDPSLPLIIPVDMTVKMMGLPLNDVIEEEEGSRSGHTDSSALAVTYAIPNTSPVLYASPFMYTSSHTHSAESVSHTHVESEGDCPVCLEPKAHSWTHQLAGLASPVEIILPSFPVSDQVQIPVIADQVQIPVIAHPAPSAPLEDPLQQGLHQPLAYISTQHSDPPPSTSHSEPLQSIAEGDELLSVVAEECLRAGSGAQNALGQHGSLATEGCLSQGAQGAKHGRPADLPLLLPVDSGSEQGEAHNVMSSV